MAVPVPVVVAVWLETAGEAGIGVKALSLEKVTFGPACGKAGVLAPVRLGVALPDDVAVGGGSSAGVAAAVPVALTPGVRIAVDKSEAERSLLPSVGARLICAGADPRTIPTEGVAKSLILGSP